MKLSGMGVVVGVVVAVGCGSEREPDVAGPRDEPEPACIRASDCPQRACEEARCIEGECRYVVDATDVDGDGADCFREPLDCDPFDPAVSPFQIEQCGNGVDDNCDGVVDGDVDDPDACAVECRDGWCLDQAMTAQQIGVVDDGDDWQAWAVNDPVSYGAHRITSAPIWRRERAGIWRAVDVGRRPYDGARFAALAVDDAWALSFTNTHVVDDAVVAVVEHFIWATCVAAGEPWVVINNDGWQLARLADTGLHDVVPMVSGIVSRVPRLHCPGPAGEVWLVGDDHVERRTASGIARVAGLIDIVLIDVDDDGSTVAVDSALHAVRVRGDVVTDIDLVDAEVALLATIERFERGRDDSSETLREPRVLRDGVLVPLVLPFPSLARQVVTSRAGRHVLLLDDGVLFSAP